MRRPRKAGLIVAAAFFGLASVVAGAPGADAARVADMAAGLGRNSGALYQNQGQVEVYACDGEADGNGVYVQVRWVNGGSYGKVGDGNGSAAGCGGRVLSGTASAIRVCEDDWGSDTCGAWKDHL